MVRPGLLSVDEIRRKTVKNTREKRKTLRQEILDQRRGLGCPPPQKKTAEEIKKEKLREWQELKKKRIEEEKKNKKPPFRSYIVVKHTGTSPYRKRPTSKPQPNKPTASSNSQTKKFEVPKNQTGFAPKINLPALPIATVTLRTRRQVKNPNIAFPVLPARLEKRKKSDDKSKGKLVAEKSVPTKTASSARLLSNKKDGKIISSMQKRQPQNKNLKAVIEPVEENSFDFFKTPSHRNGKAMLDSTIFESLPRRSLRLKRLQYVTDLC